MQFGFSVDPHNVAPSLSSTYSAVHVPAAAGTVFRSVGGKRTHKKKHRENF